MSDPTQISNPLLQPEQGSVEYRAALKYLYDRINYERVRPKDLSGRVFKLERMQTLLEHLGKPQQQVSVVHIAGTKGKGSTAVMLAEILSAAGLRTGLFTSPHIERVEERLQIDGSMPTEPEFIALVNKVRAAADIMDHPPDAMPPTFFELTTAMGWLFFLQAKADIAVLEVGLGGRLDSTNICNPLVTIITNISRDHTAILGDTLAEIAAEKGGIIKPGVPVISGVMVEEPQRVIEKICQERSAPLLQLDRDFSFTYSAIEQNSSPDLAHTDIDVRTWKSNKSNIPVLLAGAHQAKNATLAIAATELLAEQFCLFTDSIIRRGMQTVNWPLRVETVQQRPTIVVDSAHNCASIRELLNTLPTKSNGQRLLIASISRDKDVRGMLQLLLPQFDKIILTEFQGNPRALPLDDLINLAEQLIPDNDKLISASTPADAWQNAQQLLTAADSLCVTGSFFIAAELRTLILHS